MARLPRLSLAGYPQHVIQRGNNRQVSFFAEQDYAVYLDKLKTYACKAHVDIHAFVLMTNHVHLLLTPTETLGVSKLMQSLGRYYVRYVNQTYQRTGTLWEGRFKSTLVDSENYLLAVSRYIELNPVRAKMVAHPAEYPWSSYQGNALGKPIELLSPHLVYQQLGATGKERQLAYGGLFDICLTENTLRLIRQATNKSWVLGGARFKAQVELQLNRRVERVARGGDRKSRRYMAERENQLL